jgi:hypothetical protein
MQITFNLPHVFNPRADRLENAMVLYHLLECMVAINMSYFDMHPTAPGLYQSGVRYGRTKLWEPVPALYARQLGDCKSLATAVIAENRMQGVKSKPVFRFIQRKDGGNDFHILVQTYSGFTDPSKDLGMGKNENEKFYATDGSVASWEPSGSL